VEDLELLTLKLTQMKIERKNIQESTYPPLLITSVGRSSYSFRAWNKETKKMMHWYDIKKFGNLTKLISLNHIVVMQDVNFLGLYEGDIIEDNIGKGVVIFDEYIFQHVVKYSNTTAKILYAFTDKDKESIELLGNVFQNGDVL
jgi:hypothetical protein